MYLCKPRQYCSGTGVEHSDACCTQEHSRVSDSALVSWQAQTGNNWHHDVVLSHQTTIF